MPWNRLDEFDDVCQMILVSRVILATMRFKKVVTSGQLKGHTCGGPDISWRAIARTQQDLEASVLPRLNVLSKMMSL